MHSGLRGPSPILVTQTTPTSKPTMEDFSHIKSPHASSLSGSLSPGRALSLLRTHMITLGFLRVTFLP